ncbi:YqgE/AlgH family protein [Mucilaginibacter limnophilus]|uniref:YqgE/AlgH family protein n=1 Tax=Mucilaginibacter limnophilus TaxID=1932778 RepID=A0A3S2V1M6_9SPHI|nr:YqgE/AlgH family protein [Mucilaginibacter limnophilus]RVU00829.1 YqgE/AlgH family protein [Mucilaginibacter limnophilus]
MLNSISAAAGRLLISEPFMMDPNFKRSVILLTEYSVDGAMGFVLNHQSDYLLGDILPDVSYSELPVYEGGPVAKNTLHFIHRCPEKISGGIEIWDNVYWGGDFEEVKELINNYQLNDNEIKFFTGYSGWTQGQLDDELVEDTWIVANSFQADMLFNNDQNLWREVVKSLGNRYAHIANFPENPSLN